MGCSGVWISKNPGPLSELLFLKPFLCVSLRPGLSRALPGLLRCSGALCYVQKPYVPQILCSKTVCFTNRMFHKPHAMFKNRMFYKPYAIFKNRMFYKCYVQKPYVLQTLCYAMLCYVQKPYVLQTLCYVQKLYVLQTLCSTNRAFSKNSFLENIWSPHLAKQRSGERPRTPVGLVARALYGLPRSRTSTKCGVLK